MPLHQRTIVAGSLVNLDEDNGLQGTPENARSRARHTRVVNRLGVMLDDGLW